MRIVLLLLGLTILGGCADNAARSYQLKQPDNPGGRLCTIQCSAAQDYCHQGCDLTGRQCYNDEQNQALTDYDQYTRQQFAAHQPIDFRPRDFERTTACDNNHKSCLGECDSDYRLCFGNCGGTVTGTGP